MIRVFGNVEETARAGADHVAKSLIDAIAARGRARMALSGGRTPARLYQMLAESPLRERIEWTRVDVMFADERGVGAADPDSNCRLVRETLIGGLPAPGPVVTRMRADAEDVDEAVAEYELAMEAALDLLVLGMGPDGHTASLFPGSPLVLDRERRAAMVYDSPKPPPRRMTILPRVIAEARTVMMLVTGEEKARMVERALAEETEPLTCPAALARERAWFLDRDAAAGLSAR
jgi:6-phosphogluconolactonase